MKIDQIRKHGYAMPFHNPAYPKPPFRFVNREFFIISYETDLGAFARR
jgi:acetoacetate decarboxylase